MIKIKTLNIKRMNHKKQRIVEKNLTVRDVVQLMVREVVLLMVNRMVVIR
jgi:hypothetical protein